MIPPHIKKSKQNNLWLTMNQINQFKNLNFFHRVVVYLKLFLHTDEKKTLNLTCNHISQNTFMKHFWNRVGMNTVNYNVLLHLKINLWK